MGRVRCDVHGLAGLRHLCPHLAAEHRAGRIRSRMRDVFVGTYCDACVDALGLGPHAGASAEQWLAMADDHPAVVATASHPLESFCARCVAQAASR